MGEGGEGWETAQAAARTKVSGAVAGTWAEVRVEVGFVHLPDRKVEVMAAGVLESKLVDEVALGEPRHDPGEVRAGLLPRGVDQRARAPDAGDRPRPHTRSDWWGWCGRATAAAGR